MDDSSPTRDRILLQGIFRAAGPSAASRALARLDAHLSAFMAQMQTAIEQQNPTVIWHGKGASRRPVEVWRQRYQTSGAMRKLIERYQQEGSSARQTSRNRKLTGIEFVPACLLTANRKYSLTVCIPCAKVKGRKVIRLFFCILRNVLIRNPVCRSSDFICRTVRAHHQS